MSSCVKSWVSKLPWMQQGVLLSAIRGCDGVTKEDVSKVVIRGYRDIILKCAKSTGSFLAMTPSEAELYLAMEQLYKSKGFDHYPVHFILHLIHAAEIIGYEHPDEVVGQTWLNFYLKMCQAFHMHPETRQEMNQRLMDDPTAVAKSNFIDKI